MRRVWTLVVILMIASAGASIALAFAGDYDAPSQLNLPNWLLSSVIAGVAQGLIWYGAINAKLHWLAERLSALEKSREEDRREVNSRIDSLLSRLIHRRRDDPGSE